MIIVSRALWGCRRATAGLEFALVLPVMLAVYAGAVELNNFMNIYLRLNETAFELEDVLGRQRSVSDTGTNGTSIATLCALAAPIFASGTNINLTNLNIEMWDVTVPSSGVTTTQWEAKTTTSTSTTTTCARNTGTLDPPNLPSSLTNTNPTTGTPGTGSVAHLEVKVSYKYFTLLPTSLLNSLRVGNSTTSIGGPLAALNNSVMSVTAYGIPRPPVSVAPGIPYN